MAALLAGLIAAQRSGGAAAEVPLGCLARLQRAVGARDIAAGAGRGSVTALPGLAGPLTSRELEVLQMLAAGRSNQAIAGQLVRSSRRWRKVPPARQDTAAVAALAGALTSGCPQGYVRGSLTRALRASPALSCCSLASRIPPAMSTFE